MLLTRVVNLWCDITWQSMQVLYIYFCLIDNLMSHLMSHILRQCNGNLILDNTFERLYSTVFSKMSDYKNLPENWCEIRLYNYYSGLSAFSIFSLDQFKLPRVWHIYITREVTKLKEYYEICSSSHLNRLLS